MFALEVSQNDRSQKASEQQQSNPHGHAGSWDVSPTPVATACPAGYPVMSVTAMEATGPYFLPRLIDTGGNNNGVVCAKPQPDSVRDKDCRKGGEVACLLQQLGLPH